MFPGRMLDGEDFWALENGLEQEIRRTFGQRPCFGLESWKDAIMLDEWAFGGGAACVLRYSDAEGHVLVSTTTKDPTQVVYHMKRNLLPFPTTREEDIANGEVSTQPSTANVIIQVDGNPESFETWNFGEYEWAAGHSAGLGIAIQTYKQRLAEVRLGHVTEIEPFIAGRRSALMNARGEG